MEVKETSMVNHHIHFMNYFDPREMADQLEKYETISPILLRNVNGSHIVF